MKAFLFVTASLLVSQVTFAANDSIKACVAGKDGQMVEMTITGDEGVMKITQGDQSQAQTQKVVMQTELSSADLAKIVELTEVPTELVSGASYKFDERMIDRYVIATDKDSVKYLFQTWNNQADLIGTSANCK